MTGEDTGAGGRAAAGATGGMSAGGSAEGGAGGSAGVPGSPVLTDADAFAGGCGVARTPSSGVLPTVLALLLIGLRRLR